MLHAIDSKLKSIYLFVSLFYDTFFALFLYNKETKDKIDLTFESIACNCANGLSFSAVKSNVMPICIITTNIKKFLEALEARGKTAYIICIHDIIQASVTNKTSSVKFIQNQ